MLDEMIAAARGWRNLAKLVVVLLPLPDCPGEELAVELGQARRRWQRVAARLAPIAERIAGARGFNAKGEMIGAWEAPDEQPEEPELNAETDWQAAHRQHTQWVLREVNKMHEGNIRLQMELVGSVIELVRTMRTTVSTPTVQPMNEDEASKTLGLLLQSFLASQNRSPDAHEDESEARSAHGDAGGQGPSREQGSAST